MRTPSAYCLANVDDGQAARGVDVALMLAPGWVRS